MNLKNINLETKQILFLLAFEPSITFLGFMLGGTPLSNQFAMLAGVFNILFIYYISDKRKRKIVSFFAIYLILSLVLNEQVEGSRMYVSALLCSYTSFLFFYDFDKWEFPVEKADRIFLLFILILSVAQIASIDDPLSFIRTNQESLEENALDKKGFIISHAFGYYLATFAFYFAYRKKILWVFILTGLCFFFARRTNLLIIAFSWLYIGYSRYGKRVYLFMLPIFLFGAYKLFNSSYMGEFAFSLDTNDTDAAVFTSGRSLFWGTFLNLLTSGKMTLTEYLFGMGPASSFDFNLTHSGLRVWMHNDFVDLLFCMGIFGLAIYVVLLYRQISKLGIYFAAFAIIAGMVNGFVIYSTFPVLCVFSYINHLQKESDKSRIEYDNYE